MINATSRRSEIVVMLVALALPFKAGGCGTTTCLSLTQQQIMSGMCPTQLEAQKRVTDPNGNCSNDATITTIEGEGVLDGELCCYPSSKQSPGFGGCVIMGFPGPGGGTTTGFGTSTGFGAGMTGPCVTCNSALQGMAPFNTVCQGQSQQDLMSLEMCACTTCDVVCSTTLCPGNAPSDGCMGCLQTSCSAQLMACQQN
jgi:hypothetical protein